MLNLAHHWAFAQNLSVSEAREAYDGMCIDFAGAMIDALGKGRLAYFEDPDNRPGWRFHAAVEIDGWIHDLWEEKPMLLSEFMYEIGASQVEYPAEQEDERTH